MDIIPYLRNTRNRELELSGTSVGVGENAKKSNQRSDDKVCALLGGNDIELRSNDVVSCGHK